MGLNHAERVKSLQRVTTVHHRFTCGEYPEEGSIEGDYGLPGAVYIGEEPPQNGH